MWALQLKCSDTASPPRGAPGWQPYSRASPGTQPPQRGTCHLPRCATFPFCQPGSAVLLGSMKQGPAHKAHTNSSLGRSAGLPRGTAAKAVPNLTAILSAATALLSCPTSSPLCHMRPGSKKNRQRQDASRRMKWNCFPSASYKKRRGWNETLFQLKKWQLLHAKLQLRQLLQYQSFDKLVYFVPGGHGDTYSRHCFAESMMLRAFWKMHLRTFNFSCGSCNSADHKKN